MTAAGLGGKLVPVTPPTRRKRGSLHRLPAMNYRPPEDVRAILEALAADTGLTKTEILDCAVRAYRPPDVGKAA